MDATIAPSGKNGMAETSISGSDPLRSGKAAAPHKKLTQLAFMIAIMEKAISTLGTMNFVWATVVLLGGFAQSLESIDFWFVTTILVVEGLRIVCRRGELATQAATWRSWSPDFSLTFLYVYSLFIQEFSAAACIGLSAMRIQKQQYGSHDNPNRNRALNLFYWQSVVESSMTLVGLVYRSFLWQSPISPTKQRKMWPLKLEHYGFDNSQLPVVRRFLHDTYCRCINGSVFDGLKMDFVSYSVELLQSREHNDQLMGAGLLRTLAINYCFAEETLRAIGTMRDTVERLIEMLNWDKPHEQEIRRAVAEIICKLVEIPRNRIRVMAVPESIESIASLLLYEGQSSDSDNEGQSSDSDFSVLGLGILKILANDPDSCAKIGTNKGLLRKITELEKLDSDTSESAILMHLKSLPIKWPASLDPTLKSVSIDQV